MAFTLWALHDGHLFAPPNHELADAYRAFTATSRFSALDGLRAFSVIAVVWSHVSGDHVLNFLNHGNKGVDLFFAISGFLVTNLLLRERRREGAISLRNFYIRRTLRIFPLYYAVLSLYCVLVFLTFHGTPKAAEFWANFPAFMTYTSNWFVSAENGSEHGVTFYFAWSLATEEQFYLFWPPLLAVILWATDRPWVAACAVGSLLSLQILGAAYSGDGLLPTILGSLAPAILFGVAFSLLLNSREFFFRLYPVLGHALAAPAALLLVLFCVEFNAPGLLTRFLIAVLVVSLCVREDTSLHRILTWRPLALVGSISYGIYLMHMLAANGARKILGHADGLDVFVLSMAIVTAMAYLSFRYFESPLLRLKERFRTAATPVAPIGSSAGTV
ncbi:MAG: acyltransferase family protein [Ramlibacter sp.]